MQWNSNSVESGMMLCLSVCVPETLFHFMVKLFLERSAGSRRELIRLQGGAAATAGEALRSDLTPDGDVRPDTQSRWAGVKVFDT